MATRVGIEPEGRLLNRELSQMDFHARVLELASDTTLPLLERLKYCAIFSSNMDEFFQVRVAGLLEQAESGLAMRSKDGSATKVSTSVSGPTRLIVVLRISDRSRPTSSQWRASTSSLCRTSSGELGKRLFASAYFATSRSSFRSPPPPIMIGGRGRRIGGGTFSVSARR